MTSQWFSHRPTVFVGCNPPSIRRQPSQTKRTEMAIERIVPLFLSLSFLSKVFSGSLE
jgi:hypothetical protein